MKLEFSRQIFKKKNPPQLSNFMKTLKWGSSCSMWTGGRTDRHDEVNIRVSQFWESA